MQHPRSPAAGADVRRLVLGAVFAAGVAFALAPHTLAVRAANLHGDVIAQADTPKAAKAPAPATPPAAGKTKQPDADAAAKGGAGNDADTDSSDDDAANAADENTAKATPRSGNHGIFIQKGDKKITIEGLGGEDREFDSFEEFVRKAPRIAVMFFITLMVLFLLPLLIVVLLVWYKLRKNRLANETMLKLAERGVVPPAAAMDAVASGTAASVAASAAPPPPPGMPVYEQARYLRRRVVWSDLRKGVILTAVGIGLNFWSMFDDSTANGFGLVLLFVGLGYCVLWFFEDRTTTNAGNAPTPPGNA
ncbi:MAG TPA: hypothetical protein VL654_02520 [Casimicrobiaceae bacterium]|jgi:hypothetical protein|nr:hypothetical protein [Casimicrobiaceae bacterium]